MNNFSAKTTFALSLFAFCSSLYAESVDLTYTLVGKKPRTETVKIGSWYADGRLIKTTKKTQPALTRNTTEAF